MIPRIYQKLGERLAAVENPVWAGLIATFVRRKGYTVAIVDADAEDLTPEQAADRIAEYGSPLVAIVFSTGALQSSGFGLCPSIIFTSVSVRSASP